MRTADAELHDVKDLSLAPQGKHRIEWADASMPVLRQIRERFEKEKPLTGTRLSACLHVTTETANLARTLAGRRRATCSSARRTRSPRRTTSAASLVADFGIAVYAIKGEDHETYYKHIDAALGAPPDMTMDDGADLVSTLHSASQDADVDPVIRKWARGPPPTALLGVLGGTEETTTGVIRLRRMERDRAS